MKKSTYVSRFVNLTKRKNAGFTLIEILVVIGIIALLATIVIVAINPARQFAQARNTQRTSNVNTILNGIGQNIADNKGVFNCAGTNTLPANTGTSSIDNGAGGVAPKVDLSCLVPTYIPSLPIDPSSTSTIATGYTVSVDGVNRVKVCAPYSAAAYEASLPTATEICVTR